MTTWIVQLGLWLARHGGWQELLPCEHPDLIQKLHDTLVATQQSHAVTLAELATRFDGLVARNHDLELLRQETETRYRETVAEYQKVVGQLSGLTEARDKAITDLQNVTLHNEEIRPVLWHRAKYLVDTQAKTHHVSGEHKRHLVYAALIKEFPNEAKRDIGLAIELACRV
jgi:hypothetical protein